MKNINTEELLLNLGKNENGFYDEKDNRYIDIGFGRSVQRARIRESLMHLSNLQDAIKNNKYPSIEEVLELQNIIDMRVEQIILDNEAIEWENVIL